MICSSQEIAKRISGHRDFKLRFKCITLDGDIFDPSGTLSGGFMSEDKMLLPRYRSLWELENERNDL